MATIWAESFYIALQNIFYKDRMFWNIRRGFLNMDILMIRNILYSSFAFSVKEVLRALSFPNTINIQVTQTDIFEKLRQVDFSWICCFEKDSEKDKSYDCSQKLH